MVKAAVGVSASNNHYNPDEPRDRLGRWTAGGSSGKAMPTWTPSSQDWPLPNPSPVGRARTLLGHGIVGLYPEFTLPSDKEAKAFSQLLKTWNDAAHLDDQTFHHLFVGDKLANLANLANLATTRLLREAAQGAKNAETIDQMIAASRPLTQAIKAIGPDRWPDTLQRLQGRAEAVSNGSGSQSDGNVLTGFLDWLNWLANNVTVIHEAEGPLGEIAKEVNPTNDGRNCVYIVYAVVARLRGIDPKAVAPAGAYRFDSDKINKLFKIKFQSGDFNEIFDRVIRGGDGTIAIVRIMFPDRTGHVVVIANFKGQIGIIFRWCCS